MNMISKAPLEKSEIQLPKHPSPGSLLHIWLPILALICGIAITIYLLNTRPKSAPAKPTPTAILVEVEQVSQVPQPTQVSAMGEIIPAREAEIKARVSGEIAVINNEFMPGGYFLADQTMLAIDRTDYELVARQLDSEVAKAESDLALEMGNQRIAAKEYKLLDESVSDIEENLILRIPQLEKLKAVRDYAQAKRAGAQLNLDRTEINAPFNGVIGSRMVDTGAKIDESTVLAKFVGTDTFWLLVTLPVEQLRWLKIPVSSNEKGSTVRVFSQGNTSPSSYRTGRIIRLIPSLEEGGRMAQLLVAIDDPLSRKEENREKPRLLLGSYVRAEIEGIPIASGIRVERIDIHEGNTVWLMDDNGMLDIRQVEITFRGRDHVIVESGLQNGEHLVTSSLSSPVAGMLLYLKENGNEPRQEQPVGKAEKRAATERRDKRAS
jgi:RND family efflux transporter MFP subunit